MRLPIEERRALALEVLEHSDGEEAMHPDIEAAWEIELQRRRKLIEAGEMKFSPWEEVEARIFGRDSSLRVLGRSATSCQRCPPGSSGRRKAPRDPRGRRSSRRRHRRRAVRRGPAPRSSSEGRGAIPGEGSRLASWLG
ncbi:addiction module protein [Nannocystis sp.]|uniref:addiction module protein n=1 Tax=Nannocystis sp. TaxID=1962667 RepID=UPI00344FEABA